ncbi:MAG TPA: squalene synthase HpnC [Acidimicrobiales bacterium]|nr:squalene synthase HpnC [Acidimicrobiales bacterium]
MANAPAGVLGGVTPRGVPTADAVLGQAGAENFPVASRLLPARIRGHLMAIYGFARLADDIGDEAEGDRLALLDWLDEELVRAADGRASHPLLVGLTPTIQACDLPLEPFQRLIEANRVDQRVHRYGTWDDVLGYCELSANPVGELVLRVLDAATPERVARSDRVCTGLQLVEHLQDLGEDAERGRVYLPAEDLERYECTVDDLLADAATTRLRALVRYEVTRIRPLLDDGGPLAASLPGRVRIAVAGFAAGGHAALDAIERADGDVLAIRCRPRPDRVVARLASTLRTRAA